MRIGTIAASVGALATALIVAASAAASLTPGALYTSEAGNCTSPGPGITCVFKFRASADEQSLRFVGDTVVDTWICHGGGGEALLGGKKGEPIPRVNVLSSGRLYGSVKYRSALITVTGQLTNAGKAVVITFHNQGSSGVSCATRPVILTGH